MGLISIKKHHIKKLMIESGSFMGILIVLFLILIKIKMLK